MLNPTSYKQSDILVWAKWKGTRATHNALWKQGESSTQMVDTVEDLLVFSEYKRDYTQEMKQVDIIDWNRKPTIL